MSLRDDLTDKAANWLARFLQWFDLPGALGIAAIFLFAIWFIRTYVSAVT